ncbi:molybdopterin-dependent oxidoreductase [Haladaptatus sp. DFWS20]|uniref:molybdopterin-dependent oxidoreductase n=1 Tax=Haladaptatus sp. DFWS20 TaxID=3403467 RepID=UPI003EBA2D56
MIEESWKYILDLSIVVLTLDRYLRVGAAILGGIVSVAGSFAVSGSTPEFVVTPVNTFVVNNSPAELVTFSIQTLGYLGTQLAFALSFVLTVALLAVATWVGSEIGSWLGIRFASAIGAGIFVWMVTVQLTGVPVGAVAAAVPSIVVVELITYGSGEPERPPVSIVRRRFIRTVSAGLGFSIIAYLVGRQRTIPASESMPLPSATKLAEQARSKQFDIASIPGLVSATDKFYEVDINSINPTIDSAQWELSVTGAVDNKFVLTYDELRAMRSEMKFKTLRCVGEQLNANLMDNAIWIGVPIVDIINRASPQGGCECVMLRAEDGYFEEFPLAALETGFLAYGMNGEVLPRKHGYPVRALIPGHWGEINVKWLTEIEILNKRTNGYWEKRGWHGTGPVNTVAKIWAVDTLEDGSIRVAGHAYAGTRGIERVEVSMDGETTWEDATLSGPLDKRDVLGEYDAWRQWKYTWTPPPGEHTVTVRATDGDGKLQPRNEQSPFPSGPSGWVSVTVTA